MENKISLPTEITAKLKIYGIVSVDKVLASTTNLKNKILLTLSASYLPSVAIEGAKEGIKRLNLNLENFNVNYIGGEYALDNIEFKNLAPDVAVQDKPSKSAQDMLAYVLYVFDKAGDSQDKEIAQKVVENFKKMYN